MLEVDGKKWVVEGELMVRTADSNETSETKKRRVPLLTPGNLSRWLLRAQISG
jgi:hypothetical protein